MAGGRLPPSIGTARLYGQGGLSVKNAYGAGKAATVPKNLDKKTPDRTVEPVTARRSLSANGLIHP
jgi:hypothetical protein